MAVSWDDSHTDDGIEMMAESNSGLCWAYDDPEEPSTLTLYSDTGAEIFTHWITIESKWAIEIEHCR